MDEDLVKRLRRMLDWELCDYDNNFKFADETIAQAADAIDELDTLLDGVSADNDALCETIERMKKPRWISVTERLPEKNGKYLCNIKRFGQYAGMQYYYVDVLVFQEDYFFEDGIGTERVTHWMPLPEPPKEET